MSATEKFKCVDLLLLRRSYIDETLRAAGDTDSQVAILMGRQPPKGPLRVPQGTFGVRY